MIRFINYLVKFAFTGIFLLLISTFSQAQSLAELQVIAVENNPGIQSSYKRFEASMEQIPQSNTLEDPMLGAGFFIPPMETFMGEQVFSLSLSQQFPWFGTLKAKGEAVALQAEANFQQFINQKALLEFQVAEAYYPLAEIEALLEIEAENQKLLTSIYEIANNQFENNSLSIKQLFEIEMQLEESKTSTKLLLQRQKSLQAKMNSLLNRNTFEKLVIEALDSDDFDLLLDAEIDNHPLLKSLQHQEESYLAREKVARKSAMPKIGIGVEYWFMNDFSMNGMSYEGMNMLMPMVNVSLPIFNKKYKAAKKEAQLMQEASQLEYQNQFNLLSAQVQTQQAAIESQLENLNLLNFKLRKTEQILELSFNEFENDLGSFADLLSVQKNLLQLKETKQITLTNLKIAEAELKYLANEE